MSKHQQFTKWQSADHRFDSRVAQHESGCHLWTGSLSGSGYGQLYVDGVKVAAHRFSYERRFGPIPAGLIVRHKCDVRACTNPDHLEVGTPKDNVQDMVKRGRMRPACMSSKVVFKIRKLSLFGLSDIEISQMLGLGETSVFRARGADTYQHVPYPVPLGPPFIRRPKRKVRHSPTTNFNARKTHASEVTLSMSRTQ